LPGRIGAVRLGAMSTESDLAELSSLASQLEDLVQRLVAVADRYRSGDRSAAVVDLDTAERHLVAARRAVTRARADLR
jgi:hypothetical protein